jgi:outer membrane protein TolC
MNSILNFGIALGLLVQLPSLAFAIEMKDYINGALNSNPSTEAALQKIKSAEIGVEAARYGYLPKAQIMENYNNTSTVGVPQSQRMQLQNPVLALNWTLWDSGVRKFSIELAEAAVRTNKLAANATRQALVVQTLKAYALWDAQSSLEFTYESLTKGLNDILLAMIKAGKVSEQSIDLLKAKVTEFNNKKLVARVQADTFAIQVEELTGIRPKPYVDSTVEERQKISEFYKELLLDKPLLSLEDSLSQLEANNFALRTSMEGIEILKLSQKLKRSAELGAKVTLTTSLSSTRGNSSTSMMGTTMEAPVSQTGKSIGISVLIPLDAQAYKNNQANKANLSAAELTKDQLIKDLQTAVKVSHRNISVLRGQVTEVTDSLKKDIAAKSNFDLKSDQDVTNFVSFLTTVEQRSLVINNLGSTLFSSTVDFISLITDLETYFK